MRELGFYWVKYKGKWIVGRWAKNGWGDLKWFIIVGEQVVNDYSLEEIDERRIDREEWIKAMDLLDNSE